MEILAVSTSDLAHHQDIGVGTEDRAQGRGERQTCLWIDLDLIEAGQSVLDRVLDRDDVDLRPVHLGQRRVERRRLTRARRPRDEEGAGRLANDVLELRAHLVREPELRQRRGPFGLVEEAHDHALALDRREDGDADVEEAAGGLRVQRDAAVLRLAPLGDVELREDLEAGRHSGREALRDPLHFVQDAVDAEPDDERVVLGIEMEIAGPVFGCLEDDRVDQAHEGRVGNAVVRLQVVAVARFRLIQLILYESRALPGLGGADDALELELDVLGGRNPDLERVPSGDAQLIDRLDVRRVGDGDVEPVFFELVRDGDRALEHVCRNGLSSSLVDSLRREIDGRKMRVVGLDPPQ